MSDKLSDNYRTPPELFNTLNEVTPFFWDACCTKENCLVKHQKYQMSHEVYGKNPSDYLTLDVARIYEDYDEIYNQYYSAQEEGQCDYGDTIFINPPYSNVKPFIEKVWSDAKHFRVVMLLKADMSTDWFNNLIKQSVAEDGLPHLNEVRYASLKAAYGEALELTNSGYDISILHLRKRVKFLADEEMMEADAKDRNGYARYGKFGPGVSPIIETKNFKRGSDGLIYPKSGPTFPSMIVVLDRRGNK